MSLPQNACYLLQRHNIISIKYHNKRIYIANRRCRLVLRRDFSMWVANKNKYIECHTRHHSHDKINIIPNPSSLSYHSRDDAQIQTIYQFKEQKNYVIHYRPDHHQKHLILRFNRAFLSPIRCVQLETWNFHTSTLNSLPEVIVVNWWCVLLVGYCA